MRCLALIICLICCNFYVKSDDSIPLRQLDEIVVLSNRGWIENGVVNFIPTKREKRLSNSPATLVKSMHLPFLKEKDGMVVDISGEVIPVFINGVKADKIDIATFWPKDVKRVQYIENPKNPNYEGVKVAVNFIMSEYEVGGVARVNLSQRIPNNGYYTASSKLSYKRMTYGVLLSGDYYRDHRTQMTAETEYKDIFYNHERYDLINRSEDNCSFRRDDGLRCSINAKYKTDRVRMTHTISLGWNRNPGSGSQGCNIWSENLFDSFSSSDYSESSCLSPQISGNYSFVFSNKWYLFGLWQYSYAKNKNFSSDRIGLNDPIYNNSREDVNSCKFVILPSFVLSRKWFFQLKSECGLDWYSTIYTGSADTGQNQSRQEISSSLAINWMPSQTMRVSVEPGLSVSLWHIGGVSHHSLNPTVNASLNWNPVRKFSLNGALRFYMRPASASESNPVMVKTSELLWLMGNPYIKNLTSWDTYIHSTYLPQRWLSVSFGLGYVKTYNGIIATYTPASEESGGLIKEIVNARPSDNLRANIEFRCSFFNDNLSVGILPKWFYSFMRGMYKDKFNYFTISGSADYTIGDFRIELSYEGPFKELSASGMEKSWKSDNWNASLTYGNGNLYLSFSIEDIFNNKKRSWNQFVSPNYISKCNIFETGRSLLVNLTYTFGYGKKVDRSIDIHEPESIKSSVLHTK